MPRGSGMNDLPVSQGIGMLWNTTSDERLLATTWPATSAWSDWQRPDLDGFGLPLVGSLLGILPREDEEPESRFTSIDSGVPRRG